MATKKSLMGWINFFRQEKKMEEKGTEVFIHGTIVSHPTPTFSELNRGGKMMGWVFELKTQQFVGYEYQDVVINIAVVYDMTKWDILKKGQELKLSVIRKQESKYTDDGFALKCNVVYRGR